MNQRFTVICFVVVIRMMLIRWELSCKNESKIISVDRSDSRTCKCVVYLYIIKITRTCTSNVSECFLTYLFSGRIVLVGIRPFFVLCFEIKQHDIDWSFFFFSSAWYEFSKCFWNLFFEIFHVSFQPIHNETFKTWHPIL